MPALPFVPGVAKIIVKQTTGGVNCYNILHADGGPGTGWSSTELNSLASAVRSAWVTNVIPLQSSQLTLNEVTCIDLASETGPSGVATGTNNGSTAGGYLSANAAITWSWAIPRRYRGGHPRTYIGGIPQGHLSTANTIAAAQVALHTSAALAVRTAINGVTTGAGTAKLAVVHYYRNKVLLPTPLVSEISGVSVDTRIDSQRRRLGRDR